MKKIVLAGGSGFLGAVLADYFQDKAGEIVILSRNVKPTNGNIRFVHWDGKTSGPWAAELKGCDLLVNLSGKNVNCRYTAENRAAIVASRVEPTIALGEAIASRDNPPAVWINCASATIYRHAEDRYQDEETGELGTGFSVNVCKEWESTFLAQETPGTRKIVLRISMVLGRADGVLPRLQNLVKTGLGGHQGTGRQYISWIHETDFARAIEWVFEHGKDQSLYNITAPHALHNKDFMKIMRNTYGVPFGLPAPQWLLEIGSQIIGTETELILKSRWVYPKKLLDEGFHFYFPDAEPAVRDLLSTRL